MIQAHDDVALTFLERFQTLEGDLELVVCPNGRRVVLNVDVEQRNNRHDDVNVEMTGV